MATHPRKKILSICPGRFPEVPKPPSATIWICIIINDPRCLLQSGTTALTRKGLRDDWAPVKQGLQAASEGVAAELQRLAVRYGEQCAGCDPTWLLSSVFRLANTFDKALAEEDAANKPEEHQPTVDEVATLPRRKPASQRLTKSSPAMLGVSAGGHSCGEASGVLSPLSSGDESYFNPLFQTEDAQEDKASHHSSPALLHRSRPLSRVATHQVGPANILRR